jgi:hypothetical protein
MTYLIYAAAALAEIAGCYAFWAWLKLEKSPLWLAPGMVSLALFAWLLTRIPAEAAGRAFAAYGPVGHQRRCDLPRRLGAHSPAKPRMRPDRGQHLRTGNADVTNACKLSWFCRLIMA